MPFIITIHHPIQQALIRLFGSENCIFPLMRGSRSAAKWRFRLSRCNTTNFKSTLRCDPFANCLSFATCRIRPPVVKPPHPAPQTQTRLIFPNTSRRIIFSPILTTTCNNFIGSFNRLLILNWITALQLAATGMPTFT